MPPQYTQNWLNQNKPAEIHGLEGDCLNPKCDYGFTHNDRRDIDVNGWFKCPNCSTLNSGEALFGFIPGGNTRANLSMSEMGKIGEDLIEEINDIPTLGEVRQRFTQVNFPIDFIIGDFGVEVKTNHSQAQPRFKLGGAAERKAKIDYCVQNNLKPGLLGVRLNFYTDQADLFFRPGFTDTYIGAPTMRHIGTYYFGHLNPYKHPNEIPRNLPDQSQTEVDEVPFGKSDLDNLFGPDMRQASFKESFTPSNATIKHVPVDRNPVNPWIGVPRSFVYDYDGVKTNTSGHPETIYNAYSPDGELIGSAHGTVAQATGSDSFDEGDENGIDPTEPQQQLNFHQLYIHPDWRHTDAAWQLSKALLAHHPNLPVAASLEEPRLQHAVKRYNQSLGYDTEVERISDPWSESPTGLAVTPRKKRIQTASWHTFAFTPSNALIKHIPINQAGDLLYTGLTSVPVFNYGGREGYHVSYPSTIYNAYAPNGDLIGSAQASEYDKGISFDQLFVHPDWRHTDTAWQLGKAIIKHHPGKPISSELEEPRLQHVIKRYNDSLGYDTEVQEGYDAMNIYPRVKGSSWHESMVPSNVKIEPAIQDFMSWEGQKIPAAVEDWDNGIQAMNLIDPYKDIVGSFLHGPHPKWQNAAVVPSVYIDPRYRHTDAAHQIFRWLVNKYPNHTFEARIENEKLKPIVDKYNQRMKLKHQQMGLSKVAMPWNNNVFYHVTDKSNLPSIIQHGLQPANSGMTKPVWKPSVPVHEEGVYLAPDAGRGWQYAGIEENRHTNDEFRKNVIKDPVMLRIQNVDRSKIWPDHEDISEYMHHMKHRGEDYWEEDGEPDPNEIYHPHEIAALQHYDAHKDANSYMDSRAWMRFLDTMEPNLRNRLAEDMARNEGSRLMHHGPIHPTKIDVGEPTSYEDLFEHYNEIDSQPDEETDPEGYEAWNQRASDWMEQQGLDPGWEHQQEMDPWSDWDESDPHASNFWFKPLHHYMQRKPNPQNQMNLFSNGQRLDTWH